MLISSLLIYLLFAAIMFFLAENARRSELAGGRKNTDMSIWAAVIFFSLLSGFRYRVGVDCEEYAESYLLLLDGKDISSSDFMEEVELGFLFISKFMAALHVPRFIYMGFWAFLEIGLITLAMKSRKELLPFIFVIMILGPFYLSFMNGIRQSVASCAFVFAIQGLMDKKDWKKYLLVILFSCFMHKSAVLLLPFILVYFYNKSPKTFLCLVLLIACAIVGRMSFVKEYAQLVKPLLAVSGYTGYVERFDYYAELEATVTAFGPRRIVMFFSYVFVILFAQNVDKRYGKDRFYRVSFLFFMVYACLSELVVSLDILFVRPLLYFRPFVLICQGYTLNYLTHPDKIVDFQFFRIKNSPEFAVVALFSVALFFCSYCILNNIAERNIVDETTFFKFYFLR